MRHKEGWAAFAMAAAYLLLPDVGLSRPESICTMIFLYGTAWAVLTWIECRVEEKRPKRKRRVRQRRKREEYALYETYKDGTVHRVPICQEVI